MRYKRHQDWDENNREVRKFWWLVLLGFITMTCSNAPIEIIKDSSTINTEPTLLILLYAITIVSSFYYIIYKK